MTPRWEAEERLRRSAYLPGELQLIKSCIRTSRWTETTRATVRANSVENTTELTNKRESRTGLKRDPAVSVLRLMMVVSLKYWTVSQCFDILTRMRQNVILWYIIIKKGNLNVIKNISSRKQTVNTTLTYLCWFGNEFLIFTSNSYGETIPFIQSFFLNFSPIFKHFYFFFLVFTTSWKDIWHFSWSSPTSCENGPEQKSYRQENQNNDLKTSL